MAAEAEGITLLSMYRDEEEEEEEEAIAAPSESDGAGEEANEISSYDTIRSGFLTLPVFNNTPQMPNPSSPIRPKDGADSETPKSPLPQPGPSCQQWVSGSQPSHPLNLVTPTPSLAPVPLVSIKDPAAGRRVRRGALTIVDYAHDEAAMSPETEEEGKEGGGYIPIGTELQGSDGDSERTTSVTSKKFMPNCQYECLQPLYVPELSKTRSSMAMDCSETEREVGEAETSAAISSDLQKNDPLQKFLPPAVTLECSEELQEKINKFLAYKRAGKSFNEDFRKKKDYRNPDFLQHAVRYQDIEQIGTCFGKEVFDPHGYDKSDFYDEIEADMKREMESKAQERKRSQKIDFVSGGTQFEEAAPAFKFPAVGVSTGVNNELQPVWTTVDAARDSRPNKKSKWDKVWSS